MAIVTLLACVGAARADEPPPIAIGMYNQVLRDVPRTDVELSLRFWVDDLARLVNVPFKPIRFYDSLADMRRDLKAGTINFIIGTSMGIARHFPADELQDGFSALKVIDSHLLMVVRRDSGVRQLPDLAGKRLVMLDDDELSEVYFETLLMRAWRKPDESRLSSVHREKRSSAIVHRLFFNQADVALVERSTFDTAIAMNPQVAQQVMVLEHLSFQSKTRHTAFFSSRVAPDHVDRITKSALTLGDTVRGRQVLDIYHADNMQVTHVKDLEPFRALLNQHQSLKAKAPSQQKVTR